MGWTGIILLALLGLSAHCEGAESLEDNMQREVLPDHLLETIPLAHRRFARNVEGAPCTGTSAGTQPTIYQTSAGVQVISSANSDSCLVNGLPNTRCSNITSRCECDPLVAVRLTILPGAAICLPLAYVNNTKGLCLPSSPDMCTTLVSGSYCASVQTSATTRQLTCLCRYGGAYPNCVARLGSPCQNTTVCQNQIPNSYCANITNGFGTCQCPALGTSITTYTSGSPTPIITAAPQRLIPNLQQNQCVPEFCPYISTTGLPVGIQPCQGDTINPTSSTTAVSTLPAEQPFTCRNNSRGYECNCKAGTKGRTHTITQIGRCCSPSFLVCADYSKCITAAMLCDGNVDCNDCSDEKWAFCSGAWPNNTACGVPNRLLAPSDEFIQANRMNVAKSAEKLGPVIHETGSPSSFDSMFAALNLPSGKSFKDLKVIGTGELNKPIPQTGFNSARKK